MSDEITFPYLNHRISEDSKECAVENILFHLIPYILTTEDSELKKYKAIVSFDLMKSIVEEKDDPMLFLKYRSKVIKNQKYKQNCFDIYKYEYEAYLENGGEDTIIHGYTYDDMNKLLQKETPRLIIVYLFILTLLRLHKYASEYYGQNKAKQMIAKMYMIFNNKEDCYKLWAGTTNIAKALSYYLSRGHIIFGYIHTLIQHKIINLEEMTKPSELISNKVKNALTSYENEECYSLTSEIVGYALYARHTLEKVKNKQAHECISFISMPNKVNKKFGFKEIEPVLMDFSESERQTYLRRNQNINTVRHKKGELN